MISASAVSPVGATLPKLLSISSRIPLEEGRHLIADLMQAIGDGLAAVDAFERGQFLGMCRAQGRPVSAARSLRASGAARDQLPSSKTRRAALTARIDIGRRRNGRPCRGSGLSPG